MALQGAELLLYPDRDRLGAARPELDTSRHWQRAMQGHAAANVDPVVASNRVGTEGDGAFDGHLLRDVVHRRHTGEVVAEADRTSTGVITATFDLEATNAHRSHARRVPRPTPRPLRRRS